MALEQRGVKLLAVAAVLAALTGCKSATGTDVEVSEDTSGARIVVAEQSGKSISDSVLWLPDPLIATSGEFVQSLRDNQSPIQEIKGQDLLFYILEYSAGFYSFFSKSSTRNVQSEEEFRRMFGRALDHFKGAPEKIGFQTSRTGGYIWRSKVDNQHCIAGNIGTGIGGRASVGASSGTPYNVIMALFYCDAEAGNVDAVEEFLRNPKPVEDRQAFSAHVSSVRSQLN